MKTGHVIAGVGTALVIGGLVYLAMKYQAVKKVVRSMIPVELGICKEVNGVRMLPIILEAKNDSAFDLEIETPSVNMIALNGVLVAQSALNANPIVIKAKTTQRIPIDLMIRLKEIWDTDCKNGATQDLSRTKATFHISTIWNHLEFEKTLTPNQ